MNRFRLLVNFHLEIRHGKMSLISILTRMIGLLSIPSNERMIERTMKASEGKELELVSLFYNLFFTINEPHEKAVHFFFNLVCLLVKHRDLKLS